MIYIAIGAAILLIGLLFVFSLPASGQTSKTLIDNKRKERNSNCLFEEYYEKIPEEKRKLFSDNLKRECPPLRPGRLTRRMKMLWGIDVNDYTGYNLIVVGGDGFTGNMCFDSKYGTLEMRTISDSFFGDDVPESFPIEKHALYYRFVMMNDTDALKEYYEKYHTTFDSNFPTTSDFIHCHYNNAIFDSRKALIEYADKHDICILSADRTSDRVGLKISNLRLDATYMYVQEQLETGRSIYFDNAPRNRPNILLDNDWFGNEVYRTQIKMLLKLEWELQNPWYPFMSDESFTAAWVSNMLRYNIDTINNRIVRELYKREKYDGMRYNEKIEKFLSSLEPHNYYGHTILREFLTNPMREMPTLEKIGTNFTAKVKEENVLLFLEPFSDSYDIDTIHPTETFKAYEMGHDNYYLIEIDKPVESPVADKDGYAMILDRKETIYGYVLKSKVKEYTSLDVLEEERYTNTTQSKQGVINDKDGYVNVREEPNTQSKIVGKIMDKEIFNYWLTSDNWYIVETKDGTRGYVYKDRIREKYETGGWTIDE